MTSEKDFIKRMIKEMVDYFLYHELYQTEITIDYQPEKQALITISAPYQQLPTDLQLLEIGLSMEKHTELDSMYNSLLGTHSRDKNYGMIGQAIDDFRISIEGQRLAVTLIRLFDDEE